MEGDKLIYNILPGDKQVKSLVGRKKGGQDRPLGGGGI